MSEARDRASWREQPLSALLELTYACNWRCLFCFNPRHHDKKRLSAAEWQGVLDDLRRLGTLHVTLTGGEPLTHPEFFEIAEAVRSRFFLLRIFTNGTLIDEAAASRIASLHPACVELSLHGENAETHDRVTGRPGSFDEVLHAVRHLRDEGLALLLKTPLTRYNESAVEGMFDLARRLDVPYQIDPRITPKDDGDLSPLEHAASHAGAERLRETLAGRVGPRTPERKRKIGDANCALGRSTLAIDPEGNVYPCIQWRHTSLGNVREARLSELWRTSTSRRDAAAVAIRANDRLVALGSSFTGVAFCPALAIQVTGDPLGVSDLMKHEPQGEEVS